MFKLAIAFAKRTNIPRIQPLSDALLAEETLALRAELRYIQQAIFLAYDA